jgi:predicted Fe-Mo cluster-binding NifX family protein
LNILAITGIDERVRLLQKVIASGNTTERIGIVQPDNPRGISARRKIAIASEDDRGLGGEVSAHFGRCPFYTLVEVDGQQMIEHLVVENPNFYEHRPGQMPRFIRSLRADVILAGGMGPRAVEMFRGFGIDVATGVVGTVSSAVEAYLEGTLRGIIPCNHDHPESCGGHDGDRPDEQTAPRQEGKAALVGPLLVAIPAQDDSGLSALMDPRFGRAPWLVVLEVESGTVVQILANASAEAAHGAGISAAKLLAQSGVNAVIAGRFGPKAQQSLQALGIALWTAPAGLTVEGALEQLRSGKLCQAV